MTFQLALIFHLFIPTSIICLFTYVQLTTKKENKKTFLLHFMMSLFFSIEIILLIDHEVVQTLFLVLVQLLTAYYCYEERDKKVYQIVMISYFLQIISSFLTVIPLSFLYSITPQITLYFDLEFTIYAFILYDTWLLGLSYYYVLEYSHVKRKIIFFKFCTLFISQMILAYMIFLLSYDLDIWLFIGIMLCVLIAIFLINYYLYESHKEAIKQYTSYFELSQKKEDENLKEELKIINKQIIDEIEKTQALLRRQLNNEAKHSIHQKYQQLKIEERGQYSQNKLIDYFIQKQVLYMKEKNIDEKIDIQASHDMFIDDKDFISLLFNIMNNAIEACEKVEGGKYIHFKMIEKKDILYIEVLNSKNPTIYSMHLKTTKKDSLHHGVGMNMIKNIVQEYNGHVIFEDKKDIFCVKLYLKKREDRK